MDSDSHSDIEWPGRHLFPKRDTAAPAVIPSEEVGEWMKSEIKTETDLVCSLEAGPEEDIR